MGPVQRAVHLRRASVAAVALLALAAGFADTKAVLGQAEIGRLRELGRAFSSVAEKATPAVVNINTTTIIPGRRFSPFFGDRLFEYFFGESLGGRMLLKPDRAVRSLGSGVIVDRDGHMITNYHVVGQAQKIRVTLADEREYEAHIVGADPLTDIAVIRIDAGNLPTIKWGDSDQLSIGEWVVAVGSPFGLEQTVTAGIISAKGRTNPDIAGYADLLQTDAAINPGNSGGALLNIAGEVVGINTAIISRGGGYEGIGFAIPSNTARQVMQTLLRDGEVVRGWLGVLVRRISGAARDRLPRTVDGRVHIVNLVRYSPADNAGLEPDDVVISFNGTPIRSTSQLRDLIAAAPIGSEAEITIWRPRDRQRYKTKLTIRKHATDPQGRPFPGI